MRTLRDIARRLAEDPRDEGVLMNVTAGFMWLAAGVGGAIALALPGTPHEHLPLLVAMTLLSFAWGVLLLSLRFPRPGTCLELRAVTSALLIVAVGVGLWATGGARSYLQPVLLFTGLHVAYFYPPRLAWPLLSLFVVVYATPLLYDAHAIDDGYPARVLLFTVALAATYAIMRLLKRRLLAAEQRQRAMAERDALTGLANRRAFDSALAQAVQQRDQHGRSAALLLIDFDDFKAINDTHGHPVGDEVLKAVARACEPEVRGVDCLARIGGDEFAVVAPGAGAVGAERLAGALHAAVAATATMPARVGPVAVTIAWATVPEDATGAEALFRVADRRLLECKRACTLQKPLRARGGRSRARPLPHPG
ncbi:diguanylate cyclase [Conexibacter sp. CPCC 206217]|uniref:GGDEF domain-containing protein n=1 Tax=Conexibacter sp. CPCC 206217 TaxID=3064574 RepID=UPI00271CD762|nr:sensor domain-containing diguanylate cyclase [Conexibacter sp. CPCC 206217]MDO8212985.1 diguanylate cyclase [Conexibacter sp. CPCC 206217]